MREVLDQLLAWWAEGRSVGVGTVVGTRGSAPLPAGSSMLVGPKGESFGSVSGGCVEGAVYEVAQEVVESGEPRLETYGIADDDAFAVGLTCGGILDIFVREVSPETFPELDSVVEDVRAGRPCVVAMVIDHPDGSKVGQHLVVRPGDDVAPPEGGAPDPFIGSQLADHAVKEDALGLLANGHSDTLTYGPLGERRGQGMRVFYWVFAPAPRLIIFGAIDFAAALSRLGKVLGYRVTVCDARPVFATQARFPDADEVVVRRPSRYLSEERAAGALDRSTVLAVLTHDPKFDVPLLLEALAVPDVGYIGAMGSRRTHVDRLERLREAGVTSEQIERLHSPIGLDLGGRTPEETALSILGEVVAHRWGGTGRPLRDLGSPIHEPTAPAGR